MRVLFVHQNFPGQYKHIAAALARDPANEVRALGINKKPTPEGVRVTLYAPNRANAREIHPWVTDFESKVIRGEAAARAALDLKREGFTPDIVCGHPGWGEMLFLRDVWPETRILSYIEFYYRAVGSDLNFDPEFRDDSPEAPWRLRLKNASGLLSTESSDWNVSPTRWQADQLPDFLRERTSVIHDGIDTDHVRPDASARIQLGRGKTVCRPGEEIVTFVNRNLEPYRGYHVFMRALPQILAQRPRARAVIVGGEGASYGRAAPKGQTYKSMFLQEVQSKLDMSRIHFVGNIPYGTFLNLLQVSAAHVYLTYPFVLSWSMLEAMAAGCVVVGSKTPPVLEVIEHERNGLLVDFFSPDEIASAVVRVLGQPHKHQAIRRAARKTVVDQYDLKRVCLPQHLRLIRKVAELRSDKPSRELVHA